MVGAVGNGGIVDGQSLRVVCSGADSETGG